MFSKTIIQFLFISLPYAVYSQSFSEQLISSINELEALPISIPFMNTIDINNSGGHVQGIQGLRYNQNEYIILSGSSSEYSYYSIVKTGTKNMVISVNKILDMPFKHAGGFQIYENLMAIGVEDNDAKNKSKVFIMQISNPEHPPDKPLAIIDRMGTFKRATAGCVGITVVQGKVLVVVGDWDTAHLDFYRIDKDKLYEEGATLELEYSIDTKKMDKKNWTDEGWLSYQNINFINDQKDHVFLAGLTSNDAGENVIDVFQVQSQELSTFRLQKIYSRSFPANQYTNFRWGAGIYMDQDHQLKILSSSEHIEAKSLIHIYQ